MGHLGDLDDKIDSMESNIRDINEGLRNEIYILKRGRDETSDNAEKQVKKAGSKAPKRKKARLA